MTTVIASGRSEPDTLPNLRTYRGHPTYRCGGCGRTLRVDPESEVVVGRRGTELLRFEPSCVPVLPSGARSSAQEFAGGSLAVEELTSSPACKARLGLTVGLPGYSAFRIDLEDVRACDEPLAAVVARLRRSLWRVVEQESRALDAFRSGGVLRR